MKYDGKIIKQVGDDIIVMSHYYHYNHVSLAEVMEGIIDGEREYKPRYETVTVDESSIRRKEGDYVKWVFRPNEHQDMEIEPYLDCRYFWRNGHMYTLSYPSTWWYFEECLTAVFGALWDEEDRLDCHKRGERDYDTIYETVAHVGYGKTWYRRLSLQDVALNGPDHYHDIRNLDELWEMFAKHDDKGKEVKKHDEMMLNFLCRYGERIALKKEIEKLNNAR